MKKTIRLITTCFFFTSYFLMYQVFLTAYFDPEKIVEISINAIGEANTELIILTLLWPLIIYGLWDYLKTGFKV